MGLIAAIAFWMPNCSPHSLHETISVFGRWATSPWLSFTATGHRFSPGLNVFLYSSGISSITLAAVRCYGLHLALLKFPNAHPRCMVSCLGCGWNGSRVRRAHRYELLIGRLADGEVIRRLERGLALRAGHQI